MKFSTACCCGCAGETGPQSPTDGRVIITALRSKIPRTPTHFLDQLREAVPVAADQTSQATMTVASRVAKESRSPNYTDVNSISHGILRLSTSHNTFLGVIDSLQVDALVSCSYLRADCLGHPRQLQMVSISCIIPLERHFISSVFCHNTILPCIVNSSDSPPPWLYQAV